MSCTKSVSLRVDKKVIKEIFTKEILQNIFAYNFDQTTYTESHIVRDLVDWTFQNIYNFENIDTDFIRNDPIITENIKKINSMSSDDIICFRYPVNVLLHLQKYFKSKNFTETVKDCLIAFLKYKGVTTQTLHEQEYLVSRAGAKKQHMLIPIKTIIEEIILEQEKSVYIEPFMGTANVFVHLPNLETSGIKAYLNDADINIVNLLRVLQKFPESLIKNLLLDVNSEIFDHMNTVKKGIMLPTRNKKEQIASAVAFYYTLLLSHYADTQSFNSKKTFNTIDKKINTIRKISKCLQQDVQIKNNDWKYFLETCIDKHKNSKNKILVYADPPYIFTEKSYNTSKKGFNHVTLGNKLKKYAHEGVTFLLSYRATTRGNNKYTDEDVQKVLDSIYLNQGLYIYFTWATNNTNETQVEILISNFAFKGSIAYNKNIAILMSQKGFK